MKLKEHCRISKESFGEEGREFHIWIDQYAKDGYRHRQVLHNKEGVEVGVQFFGEKARKHLEQHIRDDYDKDEIPSIKDLRGYPENTDGLKTKSKYKIIRLINLAYNKKVKTYDKQRDNSNYFKVIEGITRRSIIENTIIDGTKILDVGCGTGRNISFFLKHNAKVTGIDCTSSMLDVARSKFKNVKLIEGNAEKLPFENESFDITCSFKALPHVEDIESAISEMKRVTKKNGTIFLEFYSPLSFRRLFSRFDFYTKWYIQSKAKELIEKNGLKIEKIYGSRTFMITEFICSNPLLYKLFDYLENKFTNSWLNRFSGYYIVVCKKVFNVNGE